MKKQCLVAIPVACSLFLTSCDATDPFQKKLRDNLSPILGVTGAVLGATLCSGTAARIACGAGFGLLGAFAGSAIASYLDEQDAKLHGEAMERSVATGKSQSWTNPDSGNKGTVKATKVKDRSRKRPVKVLKGKVETVPPMEAVGKAYQAKSATNVRGGPGTDYVIVSRLKGGQDVTAMGLVKGTNWYLVGENDVGIGYVRRDLLRRASATAPASSPLTSGVQGPVVEEEVAVTEACYSVQQTVETSDGKTGEETVTRCRGPNGWEAV